MAGAVVAEACSRTFPRSFSHTVPTFCPIGIHSVLFEFPKESDQQVLEPLLCGYIQNILSCVITMHWVGIFPAHLEYTESI
jgi:hypothetical protein